jgi:hypothetical protein
LSGSTGSTDFDSFLESLEKRVIKELHLQYWPEGKSVAMKSFLKSQEKSLKKLIIGECDFHLLDELKDLRLEHIELIDSLSNIASLEFLKHQVDLKALRLKTEVFPMEIGMIAPDRDLNAIWELKHLESLELDGSSRRNSGLDNLHKLKKLKRLAVEGNILEHLKFGVFTDLEELDASISRASLETIQEMKRITPNLKKIEIHCYFSNKINALLETLENLEVVKIVSNEYWEMSEKVYPKIKQLSVYLATEAHFNAELVPKVFPNLEYLDIQDAEIEITEALFLTLLSGLKQLKTFNMGIGSETDFELDPDSTLRCFQENGKHLTEADIDLSKYYRSTMRIVKKPGYPFSISKENW